MIISATSLQKKFFDFFMNDSSSENFFYQCHNFISIHLDKLEKGILVDQYTNRKRTDDIFKESYMFDKNLEKQILKSLCFLCMKSNTKMQNYMRLQHLNSKSYNMVKVTVSYTKTILSYLNYPICYDIFQFCLSALHEFSASGNMKNLDILVQNNVIAICNSVLNLDYHEDENSEEAQKRNAQLVFEKNNTLSNKIKSVTMASSLNNSARNEFDISNITIPLPTTNYMLSRIKNKCSGMLLEMIAGLEPTHYVFYNFRRTLDPDMFRKNFAYQHYLIKNFHKGNYSLDLFQRERLDTDTVLKSPLIIEIGFILFFILMKMERNFSLDSDDKYDTRIMSLIPEKTKLYTTVSKNFFGEVYDLFLDIIKLFTSCFTPIPRTIDIDQVNEHANNDKRLTQIISFYSNNYSSVDILYNGVLVPYMFPKLPFCKFRSGERKDIYLNKVNITNAKTKVESIMLQSSEIIIEIKVDYYLRNSITKLGGIMNKYVDLWQDILTLLIAALNFIILASYTAEHGSRTDKPKLFELSIDGTKGLLLYLGIASLLFTVLIFVNTSMIKIPILYYLYREERMKEKKLPTETGGSWLKHRANEYKDRIISFYRFVYSILTEKILIYFFALMVFNILGIVVHPFFYCYMITFFIVRSSTMRYLIHALWEPKQSLLSAILLMLLIVYGFTIVAFQYYSGDYDTEVCFSLWSCFISSFDQTFKNDGGLGGYLDPAYDFINSKVDIRYGRVLFDNLAFLFVALLLLEIISGIIIDKFGEFRQKKKERTDNFTSECFICGETRERLEKLYGAEGFSFHINRQHNVWDYVFFVAYCQFKRDSRLQNLTEIERYVVKKIEKNDNTWFPCYQ